MVSDWIALLAQAEPTKGPGAGYDMFIYFVAPLLLLFVFVIMPMRRDARVRKEMMTSLKNGDWVILSGSLLAKVVQIVKADKRAGEDVVVVKLDENTNIKATYLRSAVTRILKSDDTAAKDGA